MHSDSRVPNLMIVRVLTAGGPFVPGDAVSAAFDEPTIARLVRHAPDGEPQRDDRGARLVPDSISARVTFGADPYRTNDVVTLSFVDPRFARIHPSAGDDERTPVPVTVRAAGERPAEIVRAARSQERQPAPVAVDGPLGVRVRLAWNAERARRFVHVVDKLFTVDRLGWYRHVFAMRLLVPDEIACDDDAATLDATRHLQLLRAAATETLGRPLLAAFMPNFCVTPEWLEAIDSAAIARALGDLRETVMPHVARAEIRPSELAEDASIGILTPDRMAAARSASVDAFLPALVASRSANVALADCLESYRSALTDVFEQTARSAEAVRLGRMTEPNHVLDDRLWQLVGTVGATLGALAVA